MAHNYLAKAVLAIFFILIGGFVFAQTGVLAGKVIDKKNGEALIGATVVLFQNDAQVTGNVTDFDGNYTIDAAPGVYKIEISYTGYNKQVVSDFEIKNAITNNLDAALETEAQQLDVVVVTAKQVKTTDAALITIQRKAFAIQDGVSSQQISRTGSSNAADAMKQMTGAVVEGGRFIVMRGLGDRYSLSQLNGVTLPSTDPYRNSASLDLIPSQIIESIVTVKTFTPDLPGNFSGGLVNVNTKAFPEKFNLYFQVGQEFNTQSSLIDNFRTQEKGKTDWLGFEDGSRGQPDYLLTAANRDLLSSSTYLIARDPNPSNDNTRNIFDRSSKDLSNEFIPSLRNSPMNSSFNFSIGNRVKLFGKDLGFTLGANYSANFNHYNNGNVGTFIYTNPQELFAYQNLQETKSTQNPQMGALANLSYKLSDNHTIGLNYIFNNDAEIVGRNQSGSFLGQVSESASVFNTNTLEFTQRQFSTFQVTGRHIFPKLNKTEIEWVASTNQSFQEEPDLRYFAFVKLGEGEDAEFNINNAEFAFPYHFFRRLDDRVTSGKLDISIPFLNRGNAAGSNRLKFGALFNNTDRDFEEFRYQLNNTGVPSTIGVSTFKGNWDNFFSPVNFGIIGTQTNSSGAITRYNTGYHYINQVNAKNFYTGEENIFAAYGMAIYNLTSKLKAIAGVRLESTQLEVESQDPTSGKGNINLTDLLYSGNLIYALSDKANIRIAASKTLARPNMRELAPFEQFDTKNGFFNVGNPNLKRTLIQNYDLRYELYPRTGELLAISAFYKNFDDPIIRAFNPRATIPELGFINIDQASVYGLELEFRKGLDFLGKTFENFFFSTNLALIKSEYDIPEEEFNNSRQLDPTYDTRTRPFQGQAPYIVNVILSYINPEKGWESALSYNVSGEKLYNIALFGTPDVYEQEFPLLNYKLSKRFASKYQVSFTARNLLNPINKRTQEFKGREYIAESFTVGTGLGLSLAYIIK
ncbi:MAG: TonB-dependent receptor [Haliscomenobacter sp.]|uniref:TonB-dependent receptor n=1 Tax=Haliscomenobacter sp. TaxID=2717303 RepID=UPI0029B096A8|nr:TonB-dependent receptor [Haliscomenobacter sp.]MDX2070729.1 TonB-dependent receptor [Haliscomenobacter sp.]